MKKNKLKIFISCAVLFSSLSIFGVSARRDIDLWFSIYHGVMGLGYYSQQDVENFADTLVDSLLGALSKINGQTLDQAFLFVDGYVNRCSAVYAAARGREKPHDQAITSMRDYANRYSEAHANARAMEKTFNWSRGYAIMKASEFPEETAAAFADIFEITVARERTSDWINFYINRCVYLMEEGQPPEIANQGATAFADQITAAMQNG
ncbi:MAG: hypothetical protein LBR79_02430 [Oscillospiraceae bacterium]|jgi:hypothetical protein|nr:hypothetical protein [Oscillospiraceae bacterium]